jgi:hypothetical protein
MPRPSPRRAAQLRGVGRCQVPAAAAAVRSALGGGGWPQPPRVTPSVPRTASAAGALSHKAAARARNSTHSAPRDSQEGVSWCQLVSVGASWCQLVPVGASWCQLGPERGTPGLCVVCVRACWGAGTPPRWWSSRQKKTAALPVEGLLAMQASAGAAAGPGVSCWCTSRAGGRSTTSGSRCRRHAAACSHRLRQRRRTLSEVGCVGSLLCSQLRSGDADPTQLASSRWPNPCAALRLVLLPCVVTE